MVRGIPVKQKCARIHFLHATGWQAGSGTHIANFVIRFTDGRRRFIPVLYGQDVRDWLVQENEKPEEKLETEVWSESGEPGSTNGNAHRLFMSTWENPFPEAEIDTIDYVSSMGEAAPFLVAMSVEAK